MVRHAFLAALAAATTLSAYAPNLTTRDAYHKAVKSTQPTVIMVTGPHCGPCHIMKPHFDSIAASDSEVACYMIDTSCVALKPVLRHLNVMSIPMLICCHEGNVYYRCNGGLTYQGIRTAIRDFHKKRAAKKPLQSALYTQQPTKQPIKTTKALISPAKKTGTSSRPPQKPASKPSNMSKTFKKS